MVKTFFAGGLFIFSRLERNLTSTGNETRFFLEVYLSVVMAVLLFGMIIAQGSPYWLEIWKLLPQHIWKILSGKGLFSDTKH